jgi:hypothetical protein
LHDPAIGNDGDGGAPVVARRGQSRQGGTIAINSISALKSEGLPSSHEKRSSGNIGEDCFGCYADHTGTMQGGQRRCCAVPTDSANRPWCRHVLVGTLPEVRSRDPLALPGLRAANIGCDRFGFSVDRAGGSGGSRKQRDRTLPVG